MKCLLSWQRAERESEGEREGGKEGWREREGGKERGRINEQDKNTLQMHVPSDLHHP